MISVIIPCYFADKDIIYMTEQCIDSLSYEYPDELIIVDDGSPLKASKFVRGAGKYIKYKSNKGYSYACNRGLEVARGDYLVLLNNDMEVCPGWLTELTKPLDRGYGISTIRVSDSDGFETEDRITESEKFGSVVAISRATYNLLGGFDEQFRGYFADLDYRERAINSKIKIAKNHNAVILHKGKQTYKKVDPDDTEYYSMMEVYKNKWGKVD